MKARLLPALLIILLDLLAHFTPFERASLTADDIQSLVLAPGRGRWEALRSEMATKRARPLEVSYTLMGWLAGENRHLWVGILFASSALLAVAVYLLLLELLGNRSLAGLAAAFFILLPQKQELYYSLVYAHINSVYAVIVSSLALFLAHLRTRRPAFLWLALGGYTVSIFWYELGFFLPLIVLTAALLYRRGGVASSLLFFLPALGYTLWRNGWVPGEGFSAMPWINFWGDLLVTVPNLFFGRQMLKSVLYGLARFPFIEFHWLLFIALGDILTLWFVLRWLRSGPPQRVPLPAFLLLGVMGLFFILPSILSPGVISSRHTALSSIGLAVLPAAGAGLLRNSRARAVLLTCLLGLGLIISQGNAWSQVVSCRMNDAIRETVAEQREQILKSGQVLIDQYSFAKAIPYTWVKDPLNHLDTYWGVNGLLGPGFSALVDWTVGGAVSVHIVRSPVKREASMYSFQAYNAGTYQFEERRIPQAGTLLIDYALVYPNGFHHGKRR